MNTVVIAEQELKRRNQLSGAIVNIQVGNDGGLEYSSRISHGRREVRAF